MVIYDRRGEKQVKVYINRSEASSCCCCWYKSPSPSDSSSSSCIRRKRFPPKLVVTSSSVAMPMTCRIVLFVCDTKQKTKREITSSWDDIFSHPLPIFVFGPNTIWMFFFFFFFCGDPVRFSDSSDLLSLIGFGCCCLFVEYSLVW